jgi:tetratricopeptide (TPR) repeat protein
MLRERRPARADAWLRLGAALAPEFGEPHAALIELRRARGDRAGAVAAAHAASERFPDSADAWMTLGEVWQFAFRQSEALAAYERAVTLEERADALRAAGVLYRRAGRFADAAARFARAYAAGGEPAALLANAGALAAAGDYAAAEQALELWATVVPDGRERLEEERVRLHAARGPNRPPAGH